MTSLTQRSFSGGEIAPSLYARVDFSKYATSLRTCRNMYILRHGGAANRPGSMFVAEVADSSKVVRLIPFVFNNEQTYVLEFGEQYMRVHRNGLQLTDSQATITNVTQANPGVVTTSASHSYSNGDEVFISGVGGMTDLNGRNFKIAGVTSNTFQLQDMDGNNFDTTSLDAYTSGGQSDRVYEISTNYTESQVSELKFVQSADIVTIVHPSHPPAELSRTGNVSWTLEDISFDPGVAKPTGLNVFSGGAGSETFKYKVTAIQEDTLEESLAGVDSVGRGISNITKANPAVVTTATHGYTTGDEVELTNITSMTELNGRVFKIDVLTTTTFELRGIDSTNYTTFTSGGTSRRTHDVITGAAAPTPANPHAISWQPVTGALEYNVYKEENGVYGLIGVAGGTGFDDTGITPDLSATPPIYRNPFLDPDNYPSTVTYYQQRLGFANTNNETEKVFFSRTGDFKNFSIRSPLQDDDAVTFTMAGRQVNAVEHMLDLGKLLILTTGGEWSVGGGGVDGVLTPTTVNTQQYSYNGSSNLPPIVIGGNALYVQARGSIVRDLGYDIAVDNYRGNDLTILSNHLFEGFTLTDWAYQQVPHSVLWCVRSDGVLLGLTYVREQEMFAWHRHDFTDGTVENVCVVPEGDEDFLYVTVKRTINGSTRRYIERVGTRQINDVEDVTLLDSHLSYDGRNTNESIDMTLTGSGWTYTDDLTLTANSPVFTSTDVGNVIELTSGTDIIRATIKAYTSTTVVTVRPNRTVPASLQATATTSWIKAVDELSGLWHLEGKDVAVVGDGFVVASPANESYDTITVTNGKITLARPYGVIHVGINYTSDIETLDIDLPQGQTMADKNKAITAVTMFVESSRGIWVGAKPPSGTDPLEGLTEMKLRDDEGYDAPPSLETGPIEINMEGEWNNNGRVFVRQVDPVPLTILSVSPSGWIPIQ